MTRAELAALTARVQLLKRIVQALRAFDRCRTESDFTRAERDLKAALDSQVKIPLTAPDEGA